MTYTISTEDRNIEWSLTGVDRIVQNVRNLLITRMGEVPFMRDLGIDPDYIDNSVSNIHNNLSNDVIELVEKYEPRATILDVRITGQDANGNIIIEVEMEV